MRKFKAKTEEEVFSILNEFHDPENSLYDKDLTLHEALGWTWEEYATWVETGKIPE